MGFAGEGGRRGHETCDVEFENRKAGWVDVEAVEDLGFGALEVFAGGGDDGEVGCVKEAAGELEADASRCGGREQPWLEGHLFSWGHLHYIVNDYLSAET